MSMSNTFATRTLSDALLSDPTSNSVQRSSRRIAVLARSNYFKISQS